LRQRRYDRRGPRISRYPLVCHMFLDVVVAPNSPCRTIQAFRPYRNSTAICTTFDQQKILRVHVREVLSRHTVALYSILVVDVGAERRT